MNYERLFEPIKIGPLTVRNRIESAPVLGLLVPPDGHATREVIDFFTSKAKGGAGIVTVGESTTDQEYGITNHGQFVLDSDKVIPSLSALAEGIKRYGAKASLELSHGGCYAHPHLIRGKAPIGPSTAVSRFPGIGGGEPARVQEMSKDQMEEVIESFAQATLRLKRAGFDMVLLHGGHGWLLSQFLSPLSNKRTDEYGGSLENRARFPLRVLDRIREVVGAGFAIEYRLSGEEFASGGITLEESMQFAKMIESKVDCIHVSMASANAVETAHNAIPAAYLPRGRNVYAAARIKEVVSIPVTTVGAILDPEMAEQILREGKADMIAMARALLADPEWPNKVRTHRRGEIRPCIRCGECIEQEVQLHRVACAVNPVLARETEFSNMPSSAQAKSIVVIGGGPGGMQAAITAASQGHRVTLLEKDGKLGGNLSIAAMPSFKDDTRRYLDYLIQTVRRLPIDVMLSTAADEKTVRKMNPDVAIIAVGAVPLVPDIPGASAAVSAADVLSGAVQTGNKVIVIGAGMVGAETALFLAQQGKKTTLLEMTDNIAPDLNFICKAALLGRLAEHGVEIRTGERVTEISSEGVVSVNKTGHRLETAGDAVVLAVGFTPRTGLADSLKGIAAEIYVIGDCVSPRKIFQAVHEGFGVAIQI